MNRKAIGILAAAVSIWMLAGCQGLFPLRETAGTSQPAQTQETEKKEEVIAPIETQEDGIIMYANSAVNVRAEERNGSEVIGELAQGEKVTVTSTQSSWYEIRYNGGKGYVYKDYLSKRSERDTNDRDDSDRYDDDREYDDQDDDRYDDDREYDDQDDEPDYDAMEYDE